MKDTFTFSTGDNLSLQDKLGNVGTALGYLKVGVNVGTGIYKNYKSGVKEVSKYVADATVDLAFALGEMAVATGCAKLGAAIGTAIPIPVLGTVVGAATGFAVGWIVSKGLNSDPVNKAKDWIKKELKNGIDTVSAGFNSAAKAVGGFFKRTGTAIAGWG